MRHYLAIATTIALFSTVEVVVKLVGNAISPLLLAAFRFAVAGLLLMGASVGAAPRITPRDLAALSLLGLVGVTATFAAYHTSLEHIDASTGAVVFSLNPVFSTLTARVLLHEPFTARKLLGLLAGLGGVYLVSFGMQPVSFSSALGPMLMLGSSLGFGVYVAAAKRYVKRYGPAFTTGSAFLVGSVFLLPFVKTFQVDFTVPVVLGCLYLALMTTGLAYLLYFYGLAHVSIAAGTSIFYLKPIIASVLAVIVLGETFDTAFVAGMAIILASLYFTLVEKPLGLISRVPANGP
jgi:drug/metabolite transporter (DMT)-like permease